MVAGVVDSVEGHVRTGGKLRVFLFCSREPSNKNFRPL